MGSGLKLAVGGVLLAMLVFGGLWLARQKTATFLPTGACYCISTETVARLRRKVLGRTPATGDSHGTAPATSEGTWQEKSNELLIDPATGMEFVRVPGGCFQMGDTFGDGESDEKPLHEVCVDGFWMGKTEVTQGQWQKVMGSNPSNFKYGSNYPVEEVSWNDAQELHPDIRGTKVANQSVCQPRRSGNMPLVVAAKTRSMPGAANLDDVVWYKDNSGGSTHMVASKQPNGLGLYDMSGNVWEWCQDLYNKDYYRSQPAQ